MFHGSVNVVKALQYVKLISLDDIEKSSNVFCLLVLYHLKNTRCWECSFIDSIFNRNVIVTSLLHFVGCPANYGMVAGN